MRIYANQKSYTAAAAKKVKKEIIIDNVVSIRYHNDIKIIGSSVWTKKNCVRK